MRSVKEYGYIQAGGVSPNSNCAPPHMPAPSLSSHGQNNIPMVGTDARLHIRDRRILRKDIARLCAPYAQNCSECPAKIDRATRFVLKQAEVHRYRWSPPVAHTLPQAVVFCNACAVPNVDAVLSIPVNSGNFDGFLLLLHCGGITYAAKRRSAAGWQDQTRCAVPYQG